jgi:hypothetical protein
MSAPTKIEQADQLLESVIIGGDLSKLTPVDRTRHYVRVCRSVGLNPYTQPFAYLSLQGRTQLYAKKDATDQLRAIHRISIDILARELVDGIYTVRVRSSDPSGRHDEDEGIVPLPDSTKGEFRSNLMLKCVTKAKRRVTLSHCGLGMLDETEVETIPDAKVEPPPSHAQLTMAGDDFDNELTDLADEARSASVESAAAAPERETSPPAAGAAVRSPAMSLETMAREAATRGPDVLREFFNKRSSDEKKRLRKIEAELVKLYPPLTHGEE